ncbi:MAG: flagellin, partial [Chloroflexi bacterium]|nr:flagellin [Chloroflexota bacterium]
MALRINFNDTAFNAFRNLQRVDMQFKSSISKLSSGLRVNTAADDPAGLVISENLSAQAEGLGQAIRNSNDAINMVKTAEGALNEVHTLLRQIRTL